MKLDFYKGIVSEKLVILWLRLCGYKLIGHRIKTPRGELDVICSKNKTLLFAEVKFRKFGFPIENVLSERQNIRNKRAIEYYYNISGYADKGVQVKYYLYFLSFNKLPKCVNIDMF